MIDKYLTKIKVDVDQAALDSVVGTLSKEIATAGKISDEFTNDALATARKYNEEIKRLEKVMDNARKNIFSAKSEKDRQLWEATFKKADAEHSNYLFGNAEKGMKSKAEVDALAQSVTSGFTRLKTGFSKFETGLNKVTGKISLISAAFEAGSRVISNATDKISSALSGFANYAGQLNPMGAFGSSTIRGYMTRYGMSSTQAMGFGNALDAMGLSESDIGNMTGSQRKAFNELQSYWSKLMGTMDADKVQKFTKTMEQYQLIQAKFNMGIQATIMKLITSSPKFETFMGKIENLMDTTLEFLGSDMVQRVFDGLVDFLTQVVTILDKAMKLISKIPGFGSVSNNTTNNNTTTNNTYTVYGLDSYSQNETARQISYATNSGGYKG